MKQHAPALLVGGVGPFKLAARYAEEHLHASNRKRWFTHE